MISRKESQETDAENAGEDHGHRSREERRSRRRTQTGRKDSCGDFSGTKRKRAPHHEGGQEGLLAPVSLQASMNNSLVSNVSLLQVLEESHNKLLSDVSRDHRIRYGNIILPQHQMAHPAGRTLAKAQLFPTIVPRQDFSNLPSLHAVSLSLSQSQWNASFFRREIESNLSTLSMNPFLVPQFLNTPTRTTLASPIIERGLFNEEVPVDWTPFYVQRAIAATRIQHEMAALCDRRAFNFEAAVTAGCPNPFTSYCPIQPPSAQLTQPQFQQLVECSSAASRFHGMLSALQEIKSDCNEALLVNSPQSGQHCVPDSTPILERSKDEQALHEPNIDNMTPHQEKAMVGLILASSDDRGRLNKHLIFLRKQIEYFRATVDDIMSHTRGRNKAITLRQVGIRCRHCSHVPPGNRLKGSAYFPSTLKGIYQAAQNINVEHLQSEVCPAMPHSVKKRMLKYRATKATMSYAGKSYWAESAEKLGLVDTEDGIRFSTDAANPVEFPASLLC